MKQTAKIQMIKKDPCAFCDRAMNLLNRKGFQFEVVDLTHRLHEMDHYKEKFGWRTVPIILINNELIGGYNELKELDAEGKLDALVMGS